MMNSFFGSLYLALSAYWLYIWRYGDALDKEIGCLALAGVLLVTAVEHIIKSFMED